MLKKARELLNIILVLCMMLAIIPAAADDASAAATYTPTQVSAGSFYVWNVATLTPKTNGGFSMSSANASAGNSAANVTVQLSDDGNVWSAPINASTGIVSSQGNRPAYAGYDEQYIKITPADGYYIKYVVVACNDGTNGFNCQSVGNGSGYTDIFDMSTGTIILNTKQRSSGNDPFYHNGRGAPYHILVHLEKTPNPVYVVYDVANAHKNAVYAELGNNDLVGNLADTAANTGFTVARESDPATPAVSFSYAKAATLNATPLHTVLKPAVDSYESNGTTYVFSHWDVESYTTVTDSAATFPTLSGNISLGELSINDGDQYRLSIHTKLLAVYEPVDLSVSKKLYSIGNTANPAAEAVPDPAVATPGDIITWEITLKNDSAVEATMHLTDVLRDALAADGGTLIGWTGYEQDDNGGWKEVSFTQAHTVKLAANSEAVFRVCYTVNENNVGDVLVNTATIGTEPGGQSESDPVFTMVKTAVQTESEVLAAVKEALGNTAITYPNNQTVTIENGKSVTLLYKVTVTGNGGTTYTISDADSQYVYGGAPVDGSTNSCTVTFAGDEGTYSSVDVWFTKTFDGEKEVFAAGKLTNTVSIGDDISTDEDVPVKEEKGVDVTKEITSVGGININPGTTREHMPSATVGDNIVWTVTVKNTSSTSLTGLQLDEHLHCHCGDEQTSGHAFGDLNISTDDASWNATDKTFNLAENGEITFTVTYEVAEDDIGHDIHNVATVKEPSGGELGEDETEGVPTMSFDKKLVVVGSEYKKYGEFEVVTEIPAAVTSALGNDAKVPSSGSYTITEDDTSTETDETELTLIFSDDKNDPRYSYTLLYKLTVTGMEGRSYSLSDPSATYVATVPDTAYTANNLNDVITVTIPENDDDDVEGTVTVYMARSLSYIDVNTLTDPVISNTATMSHAGRDLTDTVDFPVDMDYEPGLHVIKNLKYIVRNGEEIEVAEGETPAVAEGDTLVWYITVANVTNPASTDPIENISLSDLLSNGDSAELSYLDLHEVEDPDGKPTPVDEVLDPDNFKLEVNQYARFIAEYEVEAGEAGGVLVNTATASHTDDGEPHEHDDDTPPVPVIALDKTAILDSESVDMPKGIDLELYDIDFPEVNDDGNVVMEDELTLLYKLSATVVEGHTYYLEDEYDAYIGFETDAVNNVSVRPSTDENLVTIQVADDLDGEVDSYVVDVFVTRTFTTADIDSDGNLSNTAAISKKTDDDNPIEATEEVPAEAEEPGFDFDIDIGVIPTPITGAVSVTKTVSGLVVGSGTEFKFSIYDDSGSLVDTFRLEAGQTKTIDGLAPGTYTVVESGAAMFGYSLRTYVNGSYRPNGSYEFEVYAGEETGISFNNRYTVAAALNTNDHFAYIVGYSDGTVKPNNPITRAEVATIFFRLMTDESREAYWSGTNTFDDVSSDKWYNNAISTLQNAGILDGTSFRPDDNITRAELAVIATKFSQMSNTAAGSVTFTDIQGHWAQAEIEYAAAIGWVKGYSDGTFKPDQQITRAEAMTLINRVLERAVKEDGMEDNMVAWPDNTPDAWYYEDVQEATNSHYYVRAKNQPVEGYNFNYEVWRGIMEPRDWTELEKSWAAAAAASDAAVILS
ncbi:MAG: S-layer homology domain-containing protein [Ruminococcaceae bacterium]|nr:S-layer homology domain-containing protein [Oscillospiraceae bacterium]